MFLSRTKYFFKISRSTYHIDTFPKLRERLQSTPNNAKNHLVEFLNSECTSNQDKLLGVFQVYQDNPALRNSCWSEFISSSLPKDFNYLVFMIRIFPPVPSDKDISELFELCDVILGSSHVKQQLQILFLLKTLIPVSAKIQKFMKAKLIGILDSSPEYHIPDLLQNIYKLGVYNNPLYAIHNRILDMSSNSLESILMNSENIVKTAMSLKDRDIYFDICKRYRQKREYVHYDSTHCIRIFCKLIPYISIAEVRLLLDSIMHYAAIDLSGCDKSSLIEAKKLMSEYGYEHEAFKAALSTPATQRFLQNRLIPQDEKIGQIVKPKQKTNRKYVWRFESMLKNKPSDLFVKPLVVQKSVLRDL